MLNLLNSDSNHVDSGACSSPSRYDACCNELVISLTYLISLFFILSLEYSCLRVLQSCMDAAWATRLYLQLCWAAWARLSHLSWMRMGIKSLRPWQWRVPTSSKCWWRCSCCVDARTSTLVTQQHHKLICIVTWDNNEHFHGLSLLCFRLRWDFKLLDLDGDGTVWSIMFLIMLCLPHVSDHSDDRWLTLNSNSNPSHLTQVICVMRPHPRSGIWIARLSPARTHLDLATIKNSESNNCPWWRCLMEQNYRRRRKSIFRFDACLRLHFWLLLRSYSPLLVIASGVSRTTVVSTNIWW